MGPPAQLVLSAGKAIVGACWPTVIGCRDHVRGCNAVVV